MYSFYIDVNLFVYVSVKILLHLHTIELTDPTTVQERNCTLQIIFERWMKINWILSWTENWEEAVKLLFPQYVSGKQRKAIFMEHFRVISVLISNARPEKLKDEKPFQTINEHQNTASIAWKKMSCYHQMKEINVFMLRNFTTFYVVLVQIKNKMWKKSINRIFN